MSRSKRRICANMAEIAAPSVAMSSSGSQIWS